MKSLFVGYCVLTSLFAHLFFLWAIITMCRLSGP